MILKINSGVDSAGLVWKYHSDIRNASLSLCSTNLLNGFHFQDCFIVQGGWWSSSHYKCIPHNRKRNGRKGKKAFFPAKLAPLKHSFQKSHGRLQLASHWRDLSYTAILSGKEGWGKYSWDIITLQDINQDSFKKKGGWMSGWATTISWPIWFFPLVYEA